MEVCRNVERTATLTEKREIVTVQMQRMWNKELVLHNPEEPGVWLSEGDHIFDNWEGVIASDDLSDSWVGQVDVLADATESPSEDGIIGAESDSRDVERYG